MHSTGQIVYLQTVVKALASRRNYRSSYTGNLEERERWMERSRRRRSKKTCERSRIGQDGYQRQQDSTRAAQEEEDPLYNWPVSLFLKSFFPYISPRNSVRFDSSSTQREKPSRHSSLLFFIDKTPGRIDGMGGRQGQH